MNHRRPWLPVIAALPDDPDPLAGGGGAPVPPVPAPPAGATFSQAQVNEMMARQAREGASKLLRDQLGIEKLEDAKALIAAARKAQEDGLTAQQKAEQAAKKAQEDAEKAAADAAAERLSFRKQSALMLAGLPLQVTGTDGKTAPNPLLARALKLLDVPVEADDAAVTAAVTALKTDLPALFATAPAGPAGDPGKPPRAPAASGEWGAQGAARAKAVREAAEKRAGVSR
jgi:colicin import membrane protein